MLAGADGPENYNRQAGEGTNGFSIHTKCINQEIVLDFIYIPRVTFNRGRANSHGDVQKVHLLSSHPVIAMPFQYVVSSSSRFSGTETTQGGRGVTGPLRHSLDVFVSALCML